MAFLYLQRPLQWGELAHAEELDTWRPIAFGSCAFGLTSDGSLHGVGINWGGILGGPPSKVRKGPVQIGSGHDWQILGRDGWTLADYAEAMVAGDRLPLVVVFPSTPLNFLSNATE